MNRLKSSQHFIQVKINATKIKSVTSHSMYFAIVKVNSGAINKLEKHIKLILKINTRYVKILLRN